MCMLLASLISFPCVCIDPSSPNFPVEDDPMLGDTDVTMLEAVMDVIRDMYSGSCQVTERLIGRPDILPFRRIFFDELAKAPEWVDCMKSSSCRKGETLPLFLCKAYYPYVDLEKMVRGFLEQKADGSALQKAEYIQIVTSMWYYIRRWRSL